MKSPVTAYLALGSNLGDKEESLRSAVDALDSHLGIRVLTASRVFRTAPQYVVDQDWFLNAVVKVQTLLDPQTLLDTVKSLETSLGRRVRQRYGPREIDIDILLYGDHTIDIPELSVPHPRMTERAFVLLPLCDLAPDLPLNDRGDTASTLLKRLHPAPEKEPSSPHPLAPRRGFYKDWITRGDEETEALGTRLAEACSGGEVFALCGDLGAGKTCLSRGMARGLGIRQPIQSPTFTLCRSYEEGRRHLHHWDFYRLTTPDDVESAGFEDTLDDPDGIVVVEWADKFPEFWTFPHIKIWLTTLDENSRAFSIRIPDGEASSLRDALENPTSST